MHLHQYDLPQAVSIQVGDKLGIFQPSTNRTVTIYYQTYNGPENFYRDDDEFISAKNNHYPLISVIATDQ